MNKTIYVIILLISSVVKGQVGIGNENPQASLDILKIGNEPSLLKIENENEVYLNIVDNKVGIHTAIPEDVLDININNNTKTDIKINLNNTHQSNAMRLGLDDTGEIVVTNYKVGDIIFREKHNVSLVNKNILYDNALRVYLTPGKYLIQGNIKYSSMSTKDIIIGFTAPNDANGHFSAIALNGTFTTTTQAKEAIPSTLANMHNDYVVLGGEDNTADKTLIGNISGIITITSPGYVSIYYKLQSMDNFDGTVYPLSTLKYERIR